MADGWSWQGGDGDDDEQEDQSLEGSLYGRDSVIFLIDCSTSMLDENSRCLTDEEYTRNFYEISMKCCYSVMTNKVIASPRDLVGVVLFGRKNNSDASSESKKKESDFPGVNIFQSLSPMSPSKIKDVENLKSEALVRLYPLQVDYSMADALWTCALMFSNAQEKLGMKRILLFTNNDDPHGDNPTLKEMAIRRGRDLYENGITIELLNGKKASDESFDVNKFYDDVIYIPDTDLTSSNLNKFQPVSERFEELLSRALSKVYQKRSLGRFNLKFPHGLELSVSLYNLVRSTVKPNAVRLSRDKNEELRTQRKMYNQDTGEILMPGQYRKCFKTNTEKASFDVEELQNVKLMDTNPGLVIKGFMDKSLIKLQHFIRPCQFIYPDNKTIQGSTVLFSALLKGLIERNKVGVGWLTSNRNSYPKLVALIPQEEELDNQGIQIVPPGFHIYYLPCKDDMRHLNLPDDKPRATQEQIDNASAIIKKLKIKFNPEAFDNPTLQTHYAHVEALALDKDPEETIDYTKPDPEVMEQRSEAVVSHFKSSVYSGEGGEGDGMGKVKGKKRGGDEVEGGGRGKAPRGRGKRGK